MSIVPPAVDTIRLSSDKRQLTVLFKDGFTAILSAELLRVESPSAEVQGHGDDQKQTPLHKEKVTIKAIEPVGNYAIRLIFDDDHDTGLYSWSLLYDYGQRKEALIADYRARVKEMKTA